MCVVGYVDQLLGSTATSKDKLPWHNHFRMTRIIILVRGGLPERATERERERERERARERESERARENPYLMTESPNVIRS